MSEPIIDSLDNARLGTGTITKRDISENFPVEFIVGGRRFGKNSFREKWLRSLVEEHERERDTWAPGIGLIRWACEKPSEYVPPYAPGTNGWYDDIARKVRLGQMTMTEAMVEAANARGGK